jgi:hypothetical protein
MTQLYEAALQKVSGAAAGTVVTLLSGAAARPDVREIGIFVSSAPATGPTLGLGRPAAVGVTTSGAVLGQATDVNDPAATCSLVPTWTTAPTSPTIFMRRISLPASIGAGIIWTFDRQDLNIGPSGNLVIYQTTAVATTYDIYVKWEE